jgi:hypothetical protein
VEIDNMLDDEDDDEVSAVEASWETK